MRTTCTGHQIIPGIFAGSIHLGRLAIQFKENQERIASIPAMYTRSVGIPEQAARIPDGTRKSSEAAAHKHVIIYKEGPDGKTTYY